VTSTDPTIMLTGPAPATRKALAKAGLRVEDIDLFEVNEAFASVVLKFIKDMAVDGQGQRQRRLHRHGPSAGRHRLRDPRHLAR
jgi:acetyl-CoA acetyltransferase